MSFFYFMQKTSFGDGNRLNKIKSPFTSALVLPALFLPILYFFGPAILSWTILHSFALCDTVFGLSDTPLAQEDWLGPAQTFLPLHVLFFLSAQFSLFQITLMDDVGHMHAS